jgi:hypothetical protein
VCASGCAWRKGADCCYLVLSARAADPPVVAKHPARHRLVSLRRFQGAQAAGTHQHHLVIRAVTGLVSSTSGLYPDGVAPDLGIWIRRVRGVPAWYRLLPRIPHSGAGGCGPWGG